MATTLRDKMKGLPPERRARIDAETDRLHAEYETLQELRKPGAGTEMDITEWANFRGTPGDKTNELGFKRNTIKCRRGS